MESRKPPDAWQRARSEPERSVPLGSRAAPRVHDRGAPAAGPALGPRRARGASRVRSGRQADRERSAPASGRDGTDPRSRRRAGNPAYPRLPARPAAVGVPRAVLREEPGDRRQRSRRPVRGARDPRRVPAHPPEHHPSRRSELHLPRDIEDIRRRGRRPPADGRRGREGGRAGRKIAARVLCRQPQPASRGGGAPTPSSAAAPRSSARSRFSAAGARTTRCSWAMRGWARLRSRRGLPR